MIRANMLYRKNAKENPPDPNEWEGGSSGNTPIVEPDDESAFVFDTGEYNNSGVKGFIKAYKGESEVISFSWRLPIRLCYFCSLGLTYWLFLGGFSSFFPLCLPRFLLSRVRLDCGDHEAGVSRADAQAQSSAGRWLRQQLF